MKKIYLLLTFLALSIGMSGFFICNNLEIFNYSPTRNNVTFENLSMAASDASGNLYIIDQSMKRLIKVDAQGTVQHILHAGSQNDGGLHLINDVASDANGNMYVLNTFLDQHGYYVNSEVINRYTGDGNLDKTVYRVDYTGTNRPVWKGRLKTLRIRDGFLYFFNVNREQIVLKRLTLNGKSQEDLFRFQLPAETYISEIAGTSPDAIFYTTINGIIYHIDPTGKPIPVYSSDSAGSFPKSLPLNLDIDATKRIFINDAGKQEIAVFNTGEARVPETLLSREILIDQGYNVPFDSLKSVRVKQDGSLIAAASNRVFCLKPDGRISLILNSALYSGKIQVMRWLVWLQPLLILGLLCYALRIIYINLMHRRISLLVKQVAVFVPLIVIAMVLVSGIAFTNLSDKTEKEMYSKLKLLTHYGAQVISGDQLQKITGPESFMNSDYKAIREKVHQMFKNNTWTTSEKYYVVVYKLDQKRLYICLTDDDSKAPYYPVSMDDAFTSVLANKIVTGRESDSDGDWMYAIGPLYDSAGNISGEIEVGIDMVGFTEIQKSLFFSIGKSITLMTVAIVVVFLLMSYFLLQAIRVLRKGVHELAGGKWDTIVNVKTHDEVADLCDGFNTMAEYIKQYISKITILSESYFRFVPQQFLKFLHKESITDVHLGDQVKQEMGILFSNIRSFPDISENLTPEENFALINEYLKTVGPVVRNEGGFIDKYLGAGIMALFPGQTEDALKAAIGMRKELAGHKNLHYLSATRPMEIGIGIHKGPVMLGIIGEEKRLEGTVISSTVNLTYALEKIAPRFGSYILITENILREIAQPEQYQYRKLGFVQLESTGEPIKIYDVFQGDPEHLRKAKQETKKLFEEGIMLYQDGRFYDARCMFVEVIRQNYLDEAAKVYFFLCDEFFKNGAPENWNGALSA